LEPLTQHIGNDIFHNFESRLWLHVERWQTTRQQLELDFPAISLATPNLIRLGLMKFTCCVLVPHKYTITNQLWWTTGLVHHCHFGRGSLGMDGCWIASVCLSDPISVSPS